MKLQIIPSLFRLERGNAMPLLLPSWKRAGIAGNCGGAYRIFVSALLLLAAVSLVPAAFAEPKFPPLTGRVVDDAHLLTAPDKAAIEADLKALEQKSSDQLVVFTTNSLQGLPIEDFGYQLGRAWGIGQKGTNNGVLLIVAPTERKVRIEVGRGLEPQLTDLMTSLIIRNRILPEFRRGQFSAGVKAGVHDIKDVMLGDAEAVKQRAMSRPVAKNSPIGGMLIPLIFLGGIFIFVLWAQSRQGGQPLTGSGYRRSGYRGPVFFPGGWGGGGGSGGGGGGFSGGGGDFGGGGASGDW